jgi:mannose-6-phosphate isomerase-like protein (cupin superfamily)
MRETVIREAEAPRFGAEGTEITGYASPTRGSETVSAWKVRLLPGAASPVHQLTAGEAFIALAGRARFEFAEHAHEIGAGDAICVPPRIPFRLANGSEEPFEAICCMVAGGKGQIGDGEPFTPPWAQ